MLIDMHVHTTLSACSRLRLADVLDHSRHRGLDGVCITDHDTMAVGRYLQEGLQPDGLFVFFGLEYATPEGDFLLFGPFENIARHLSARRLLDRVAAAGGVAIAAHPCRRSRPVSEYLVQEGRCQIVESVNGRNRAVENQAVDRWRRQYAFAECAGSDAHSLAELGRVCTCFHEPVTTRAELVSALQNGLCAPETAGRHLPRQALLNSLPFAHAASHSG